MCTYFCLRQCLRDPQMHVEMTQKNIAMPKTEPIHIKVDHSLKKNLCILDCRLLITFANSLDTLHGGTPQRVFRNSWFWDTKSMHNLRSAVA